MDQRTDTCEVILEPAGISLEMPRGTTISEAASSAGVRIRADCGGQGLCGKCRVKVHPLQMASVPQIRERELLSQAELEAGIRLACQCEVEGPLKVEVLPETQEAEETLGKTSLTGRFQVDPTVIRVVLGRPAPRSTPSLPRHDLVEHLVERMAQVGIGPHLRLDPEALRELSLIPSLEEDLSVVCHKVRGVTGVRAGVRPRSLGVAMDIGTTTLAVYLCDLDRGEILASAGASNPQRRFGEDVISRVALASQGRGPMETLHRAVIEGLNRLMGRCLARAEADPEDVDEVVAVGNTCMVELFCGINPKELGRAPYLPVARHPLDLRAGDLGLEIPAGANVHVLPVISGFVGADAVAGILAQQPYRSPGTELIVDIGTNGELVLWNSGLLWATSCATGPALEGAHISCGMRAMPGAICRVWEQEGRFRWEVLGDGLHPPKGICGSGIVDAMAAMRKAGVLLPNGRLREGAPNVTLDAEGVGRGFRLVEPAETATGKPLVIKLEDVRQIQLAKAALCVGIRFLMRRAGVERVDRLVLTGAFGASFDWHSAVSIGMLPAQAVSGQVQAVENAAGKGAVMALLDHKKREEAWELASMVQVVDLAQEPDFQVEYPMAMGFPPLTGEETDPTE